MKAIFKSLLLAIVIGLTPQLANALPIVIIISPTRPIPPVQVGPIINPNVGPRYITAADVHATFASAGLSIRNVIHIPLAGVTILEESGIPGTVGWFIRHKFGSYLEGDVFNALGGFLGHFVGTIDPITEVTLTNILPDGTEVYKTVISMETLAGSIGGIPFALREDPDKDSVGEMTIKNLGGNRWAVTSFFDVFTELSIDSGPFEDATGAARVHLVPEPATLALFGLGFGLLGWLRKKAA